MAFVVKKINLDDIAGGSGTYTYEEGDDKITLTLNSYDDRRFQKAYGLILDREKQELEAMNATALDDAFLDNISVEDKSTGEMITRAMAKFLIRDWDAVDEDGEKLPVTGDNLLLLTASTKDPAAFIQWVFSKTVDVAVEHAESLVDTKKKPSPATSGKKTTKTSVSSKKP